MAEQLLSRKEAAKWLRDNYGLRVEPGTLAAYAVRNCGPEYQLAGKNAAYPVESSLRPWAEARTSGRSVRPSIEAVA